MESQRVGHDRVTKHTHTTYFTMGFPSDSVVKNPLTNAGDASLNPGLKRSPGEEKGYPLQYSDLENSTDCIDNGVTKNQTQLCDFHFHIHF